MAFVTVLQKRNKSSMQAMLIVRGKWSQIREHHHKNVVSMSGIPGLEQEVCLCGGTEGGRAKLGPDNHGIHSLKIILFYF